jgi:signal transduction histidine kinase/CheY-like chemotaxis protein
MGARIRALDWSVTALGAVDTWSHSLRTLVELMLASQQPSCIAWGEELVSLFNDAYLSILGSQSLGQPGLPFAQLWADAWDEFRPWVDATLQGEAQQFVDCPIAGREGLACSWFTFSWTPIRDGDGSVAGFYCVAVDTTAKVSAERALRRTDESALRISEDRYQTLFNAIDEGFCIFEVMFDAQARPYDYRFLEANQAFERHTGIERAVGRRMREIASNHEDWWFEVYGRVALTGEATRFENYAGQLGERWFDLFAFRVGVPEKRQVAVLFNDITARKAAERALKDANRRKDEFLATLAHELRNPLAPLRTGLEIARLKATLDASLTRTIDSMDRQLSHLVRLVDDLLDVARITSGKLELKKRRFSLGEVLASSVEATSAFIEKQGHRLVIAPGGQDIPIVGDFDRLSQVFTNLLTNAAKYMAAGGIIQVGLAREGSDAVVRVTDAGIGIPASELGQVFELFSQVRAHQGMNGGGLGIGLALVRSLVTLHGGRVEVHSGGPGRGSSFSVYLPAAVELAPAAGSSPAYASDAEQVGRKILVADDNVDGASMLAELLELGGHQVWVARDGQEALEMAIEFEPEVVFLDLGMPRMDGYEAAQRIRATSAGRGMLLVALTGWGKEEDRVRTREAGFDQHLVKPVDGASLARVLA